MIKNFTVTSILSFDIDEIIDEQIIILSMTKEEVAACVREYIAGMDDCDFYLVTDEIEQELTEAVYARVHEEDA